MWWWNHSNCYSYWKYSHVTSLMVMWWCSPGNCYSYCLLEFSIILLPTQAWRLQSAARPVSPVCNERWRKQKYRIWPDQLYLCTGAALPGCYLKIACISLYCCAGSLLQGQTYLMKTLISLLFNIQHGKPRAYNKTEIFFADMNGVSSDPTIQHFIILR